MKLTSVLGPLAVAIVTVAVCWAVTPAGLFAVPVKMNLIADQAMMVPVSPVEYASFAMRYPTVLTK